MNLLIRSLASMLFCLLLVAPSLAQKQKREPLTEAEVDKIAEAGVDPNARVDLYTQFLNEHADAIKSLSNRKSSDARASRLSDALEDFTALMDELGENLDMYSERKADIRKSLQKLNDATSRWQGILRALAGEPGFSPSFRRSTGRCAPGRRCRPSRSASGALPR
jgi:hypothetical protein